VDEAGAEAVDAELPPEETEREEPMQLQDLQVEIECRLRQGESLSRVEESVIDRCEVPEDAKSALWLYGWCLLDDGRRDELSRVNG
jgi:hypothetical protein